MTFGPEAEAEAEPEVITENDKARIKEATAGYPTITNNLTIKQVNARMSRMVYDIPRLVSARANTMSKVEKDFMDKLFDDLVDFVQNNSDSVPQGYITSYDLEFLEPICRCENETLYTVAEILFVAERTLRTSDSTRLNSGFIATELVSFLESVARAKLLYTTQFINLNPLNYGASSPKYEVCNGAEERPDPNLEPEFDEPIRR